ncbi:MAG: HD domain-containing protein [Bacteroidales bacterium]
MPSTRNKRKIINDPVHGFINIPFDSLLDLIEHPYFQRLQRIRQLGLTSMVYPGATHSRFQHGLGAMHLMGQAISIIRSKGHEITDEEAEAVTIAILLHDIGHGPFSHTLEETIVDGIHHEDLSRFFMEELDKEFQGRLRMAIRIFRNEYPKKFLHQLVSSQLDMDRLDYLRRDSFFTGVTEGVIGSDRIIKMLNVVNDTLVVEAKGIYSIEKFLIARRLMYWQVYLHKTVLSAEKLMLMILRRAKELAGQKQDLFCTPSLRWFLYDLPTNLQADAINGELKKNLVGWFAQLDDNDIMASAKVWALHRDRLLSILCGKLVNRNLNRVRMQNEPLDEDWVKKVTGGAKDLFSLDDHEVNYLVIREVISNHAYSAEDENIQILFNNGEIRDISDASDMLNISVLSKVVRKHVLCYPKEIVV